MDIYIYTQRSFGGCSTFLNYPSSPFTERRHYRETLDIPPFIERRLDIPPFIERRPYREILFFQRSHMCRWIYIYTALLWRLFNFPQLPLFSLHRKASLSWIFGYSSLHWKASLSRIFGYSLSSSFIERRHYREFLDMHHPLKGVTMAKFRTLLFGIRTVHIQTSSGIKCCFWGGSLFYSVPLHTSKVLVLVLLLVLFKSRK